MRSEFEQYFKDYDIRLNEIARDNFSSKANLVDQIYSRIIPFVNPLIFDYGKGTSFFFAPGWIVSNSHVVSNLYDLKLGQIGTDDLVINKSAYFRPRHLGNYPDLMIASILDDTSGSGINSTFTSDPAHDDMLYFYIDIYDDTNPIKFLDKQDVNDEYLNAYKQLDGNDPRPGVSGSPVIAARLLLGKPDSDPYWDFKLDGVLFSYQKGTNFLYSVPLEDDLLQIKSIMDYSDEETRARRSGDESIHLGASPHSFFEQAANARAIIDRAKNFYEVGEGAHYINLPPSLIPLNGDAILPIEKSYYLDELFWKEKEDYLSHLKKPKSFDVDGLRKEMLEDLLGMLDDEHTVNFNPTNGAYRTLRLRIDIDGIGDVCGARFSIQDNFKDRKGARIKINKEPISGVFSSVRVYSSSNNISSNDLKKLLLESISRCDSIKFLGEALSERDQKIFELYCSEQFFLTQIPKKKFFDEGDVKSLSNKIKYRAPSEVCSEIEKYDFSDEILAKYGIAFTVILITNNYDIVETLEALSAIGFRFDKCSNQKNEKLPDFIIKYGISGTSEDAVLEFLEKYEKNLHSESSHTSLN